MKYSTALILVLACLAFTSCTSKETKKELDTKLEQEPNSMRQTDVQAEASRLIETTPGLSDEQRKNLISLRNSIQSEMAEINQQSLELRSVLIKDVMDSKVKIAEIDLIKSRLRKVETKKLNVLFGAVDKAEKILGRDNLRSAKIFDEFMFSDMTHPSILK